MRTHLLPLIAVALAAAPADAHPKLVAASPAPNAAVAAPARITLRFSERLVPRFSGADIVMIGMPGMKDHSPMKVAAAATVAPDGWMLIVTPARPLARGTYRVDWHAVAADTHRVTGSVGFGVK